MEDGLLLPPPGMLLAGKESERKRAGERKRGRLLCIIPNTLYILRTIRSYLLKLASISCLNRAEFATKCFLEEKDREDTDDWMVHDCCSSESESELEFHVDVAESSTEGSVEPVDLEEHLPLGWSGNSKKKRSRNNKLKLAALNEARKKSFANHILEASALNLLLWPHFQGLGGHLAAHNRKREGGKDLVRGVHQDSRGKSLIIGGVTRKEYKCYLCEKRFPSGQALGGHMSYHGTTHNAYKHQGHHKTADTEYISPSLVPVSHLDPQLGNVLDLNMVPDEGLCGIDPVVLRFPFREDLYSLIPCEPASPSPISSPFMVSFEEFFMYTNVKLAIQILE
ncbi:hypothetical protein SADUNF_Sadunf11G0123400 [Salix dunnii]|uniref:C2H2-type domain-containing protein n=1 Tax=Salix dunnii TaxID=1413687 RepID=A0A835JPH9_9ROSI|nr:hypothetical protein SADUNF_Sadunf11G0123400 [Salix dunnii]